MAEQRLQHPLLVAFIAALLSIGGTLVVQRLTQPLPGLRATGTAVVFAPQPDSTLTPRRIGPVQAYWHLTVRNTGSKAAQSVRLRFPPTVLVQVGDKYDKPPDASTHLGYSDLGTLGPGDQIDVDGWSNVPVEPDPSSFSLVHSEGYGAVSIKLLNQTSSMIYDILVVLGVLFVILGILAWIGHFTQKRVKPKAASPVKAGS